LPHPRYTPHLASVPCNAEYLLRRPSALYTQRSRLLVCIPFSPSPPDRDRLRLFVALALSATSSGPPSPPPFLPGQPSRCKSLSCFSVQGPPPFLSTPLNDRFSRFLFKIILPQISPCSKTSPSFFPSCFPLISPCSRNLSLLRGVSARSF